MATFNTIRGQEPSTVTFKVATVQVVRNSSNIQQEILSIGDAESSLGIARVTAAAPASTEYGLVVRIAGGPSSVADLAVRAVLSSTAADNTVTVAGYSTVVSVSTGSVRVHQSSAADLNVTVAGYVAPSTVVSVSTGSVRVHQSTAADLNVTVAGYSTTANVSSVAGIVAVRPSDTNWASSAGFHFDGAGNLNIAGSFSASTIATVTQLLDSSGGSVSVGDNVNQALRVNVVAGAAGGSTIVTVSTGSVRVHQSTAADLNVTVAGYSTTVNVSSLAGKVAVDQNSTVWFAHARVFDSSGVAIAASTAAPATGDNGLTVRQVGFVAFSTTVQVSSLAGKVLVDQNSTVWPVQVSSVAGKVLVDQNSTVWPVQVSSVAGVVTVTPNAGSTWAVRPLQSSQADLRVTAYQSTAADFQATVNIEDGVGNPLESSTSAPSTGARGLLVRPILGGLTTYSASTAGQSSLTTIVSSAAANRAFVYAYSITTTLAGPVQWGFYSGSTLLWGGILAATSSAVSGVNLAVTPPGYLFAGSTGQPFTFNVASSHTGMNVSVAYWQST